MKNGYDIQKFPPSQRLRSLVREEDWNGLDAAVRALTLPEGELFTFLRRFQDFGAIEFIISIRDAGNDWEEDGIWHDDGSRVFAFSLSLTENAQALVGGNLGIRKIGDEQMELIPTPEFGTIILFLTGVHGYEHRIHRVEEGRRIIIAGWCS